MPFSSERRVSSSETGDQVPHPRVTPCSTLTSYPILHAPGDVLFLEQWWGESLQEGSRRIAGDTKLKCQACQGTPLLALKIPCDWSSRGDRWWNCAPSPGIMMCMQQALGKYLWRMRILESDYCPYWKIPYGKFPLIWILFICMMSDLVFVLLAKVRVGNK